MRWDRRGLLAAGLGLGAAGLLAPRQAEACTGIRLKGADGSVIFARTLEWGTFDMMPRLAAVPSGIALQAADKMPDGKPGIAWTGRHKALAIFALGKPVVTDGLNEAGLVVGMFYHPGTAVYAPYDPAQAARSMAMTDLAGYLLTNCATVAEVRAALADIRIAPVVEPALGFPAPAHVIAIEESGQAVVIESLEGALRVFDAPFGVITNSPSYDWHMTNVRNYLELSPADRGPRRVAGVELAPIGVGSGLLGLPGDYTPPSRFIRAAAYVATARHTTGGFDTVRESFRILDNFDLPVEAVSQERGAPGQPQLMYSATQWTVASDIRNRAMYYHTQFNRTLRRVKMADVDFASLGGRVASRPLDDPREEPIRDVVPRP
ncbi:linear amide C-N hydrolase [Roseomonas sp. HJA6]|uniref:Linear amide C-N hydrolase n=1 Tax=Roseomonas alba TaxID=2846776 RepID=A0ABS7A715_9PROT|nr:linear amide C-N hydrolase [Neoroseomonas alba]MBW6397988.1 linear amide C-N hydrolase [Neoroseomonas alba]